MSLSTDDSVSAVRASLTLVLEGASKDIVNLNDVTLLPPSDSSGRRGGRPWHETREVCSLE